MRVRAKARGYDGVAVREEGDVFDFSGKLGSWMEPVDDAGNVIGASSDAASQQDGGGSKRSKKSDA